MDASAISGGLKNQREPDKEPGAEYFRYPNIPLIQNLLPILALMALPNASVQQVDCLSGQSRRFFSQEGAHEYNLKDGKLQD